MLFRNAIAVSDIIKKYDDKTPRSLSEQLLDMCVDTSEQKTLVADINNGICFGCGSTESNHSCNKCQSIMFCRNCEKVVLKKHENKCSGLIAKKNRNDSINAKITQIIFKEQFSLASIYISAKGDLVKQRKIFAMYTNYYFNRWEVPVGSEEKIALMASMAGLLSTTMKIAKITLDISNFETYLLYINKGGICFSCLNTCKTQCSRCRITTCKSCQTDETHRLLCKTLSI